MTFNPDIHHRHSIRLEDYDYTTAGAYFVTICTQGKECLLGTIVEEYMVMNNTGRIVESVWLSLPERFSGMNLDAFVVMPNHIHFIVFLVGAPLAAPCLTRPDLAAPCLRDESGTKKAGAASGAPTDHPTLGAIMRAFKSITAIEINRLLHRQGQPLWQRNYYERIVRNEGELHGFREYIHLNPQQWSKDEHNNTPA